MHAILKKSNAVFSAATLAVLLAAGSPSVAFARGSNDSVTSGSSATSGSTTSSGSNTRSGSPGTADSATTSGSTSTEMTASATAPRAGSVPRSQEAETEPVHAENKSAAPETQSATEASETSDNNHDSRHDKAEKMLGELQATHKSGKTEAEKTKACDEHKAGLETKFTSIARNSAAYQSRIDAILAQAVVYQSTAKATVTNFDALVKAADVAQATAKTSVAAVQSASTSPINCTDKTAAANVAEFKVTAANARRDLKAYKLAVKAVLQSLRDAKSTTETTTVETPKTTEKSN